MGRALFALMGLICRVRWPLATVTVLFLESDLLVGGWGYSQSWLRAKPVASDVNTNSDAVKIENGTAGVPCNKFGSKNSHISLVV